MNGIDDDDGFEGYFLWFHVPLVLSPTGGDVRRTEGDSPLRRDLLHPLCHELAQAFDVVGTGGGEIMFLGHIGTEVERHPRTDHRRPHPRSPGHRPESVRCWVAAGRL